MTIINNMNDFIKKLIERLEDYFFEKYCIEGDSKINDIVNRLAEKYNNGWIPCSERFPGEPERTDDVEESIYIGRLTEYNVMIQGAEKSTTLYYAGDGYWYDEVSQEYYPVIAWQPLPAPYQLKGDQL